MNSRRIINYLILALCFLSSCLGAQLSSCGVCRKFVKEKIIDEVPDVSKIELIRAKIMSACGKSKGKDTRFCWYIGAMHDSATGIINEVIKVISMGLPIDRACDRLGKLDHQICELEYDKEIDWKTVDLNKFKVRDLKKVLDGWGEQCKGCTEKSEFVRQIIELKPKYVKEEL